MTEGVSAIEDGGAVLTRRATFDPAAFAFASASIVPSR
jgi:hypothetical protein